jgi:hypothetical protein
MWNRTSDLSSYITQWLKIATEGRVVSSFSAMHDRMILKCLKCEKTEFFTQPTGTTIDDSMKVFVNRHAHCDKPISDPTWIDQKPKPTGVTADFKNVPTDPWYGKEPKKWFGEERMKPEIKEFSDAFKKTVLTAEELTKRAEKMKAENAAKRAIVEEELAQNDEALKILSAKLQELAAKGIHPPTFLPRGPTHLKPTEPRKQGPRPVQITNGRKFR